MATAARVVVVGGGVVGVSILYHLAERGWTDSVLCERTELTSGSTWHAAGHVITYGTDPTICRLNEYGARLYAELESRTGQSPGYHRVGNLRLATHPDRLDEYERFIGIAAVAGIRAELLSPAEVEAVWPLVDRTGLEGGLLTPDDGHIDPYGLTMAFAAGARRRGASILQHTEVIGFTERRGGWRVHTSAGDIDCEHVVSCTGNHSRQTLAMIGLPAQTVSIKHQYLVSGPIPELVERRARGLPEMPVMRDPEQLFYVRQEGDGVVVGYYGGRGEAVFMDGVPAGFDKQLFGPEIDALLPYVVRAAERVPALESIEIRSVVNGPQPYSPDDRPITGPAFGRRNFWLAEGNPNGITLAGGIGWQLATWIVDGEPSLDMWPCDSRRFGAYATRTWSARRTEEANERTYQVPLPDEEPEAARPLKSTPIHDLLAGRGAVFGEVYGWERPNWFAPEGVEPVERYGFRERSWAPQVRRETAAIRAGLVVADLSHDATFEVAGAGARAMLESLTATTMPDPGHLAGALVRTGRGTVRSSFEIYRDGPERYLLSSSPGAERYDLDLLEAAVSEATSVRVVNLTGREGCLLVSGAAAPAILGRLSKADIADLSPVAFDDARFPAGAGRWISVGYAPVRAVRTDRYGPPAWTLHADTEFVRHLFLALFAEDPAITLVGARSLEAMRIECRIPAWGREITSETIVTSAGFARIERDEVGSAISGSPGLPVRRRLCTLTLAGPAPFPLTTPGPIHDAGGTCRGHTTSAGTDYAADREVAFAFVDEEIPSGVSVTVQVLGERLPAVVETWQHPKSIQPDHSSPEAAT